MIALNKLAQQSECFRTWIFILTTLKHTLESKQSFAESLPRIVLMILKHEF